MGRRDSHATLITSVGVAVAIDGIVLRISGLATADRPGFRCRPSPSTCWAARSNRRRSCSSSSSSCSGWGRTFPAPRRPSSGWPRWRRPPRGGHGPRCQCADAGHRGVRRGRTHRRRLRSRGRVRTYANPMSGDNLALFGSVAIAIGGSRTLRSVRSSADSPHRDSARRSVPVHQRRLATDRRVRPVPAHPADPTPWPLRRGRGETGLVASSHARPPSTLPWLRAARPLSMLALGALVLVAPWLGLGAYWSRQFILIAILALVVSGLNISLGYAGELALAQVALYAVGAYVAGYLAVSHGVTDILLCLLAAIGGAVVVGPCPESPDCAWAVGPWPWSPSSWSSSSPTSSISCPRRPGGRWACPGSGAHHLRGPARRRRLLRLRHRRHHHLVAVFRNLVTSSHGDAFLVLKQSPILAATLGISVYRLKLMAYVVGAIPGRHRRRALRLPLLVHLAVVLRLRPGLHHPHRLGGGRLAVRLRRRLRGRHPPARPRADRLVPELLPDRLRGLPGRRRPGVLRGSPDSSGPG